MNSAICTLFEGHYHHGVAALTNSLYKNGFRGSIYVGYRGVLPPWAEMAIENKDLSWENGKTLKVAIGLELHFLPIDTDYHLANYKPKFMLKLWKTSASKAENMFYFDPDIIVKCKWIYYENWINHGVALVHEIVSNDMPSTHPIRKEWEKVIIKSGRKTIRYVNSYINSGFCGLKKNNIDFIKDWSDIIQIGIDYFKFNPQQFELSDYRGYIFYAQDQDALNIAAMCTDVPISEMGPEAMDFIHGGFTMSHAVGGPKPWKKHFVISALKGIPPSLAEKAFWQYVDFPIRTFRTSNIKFKMLTIKIASFIGRFYRKY